MSRLFIHPPPASSWATTPCTCERGYSLWHTLALGLLEPAEAREFLASTLEADGSTLLDDLREHTKSGTTVEQILCMRGTTLLRQYRAQGSAQWVMHPVVTAFEVFMKKRLTLFLAETKI